MDNLKLQKQGHLLFWTWSASAATGNFQHIALYERKCCTAILHVTINLLVYYLMYHIDHVNATSSTGKVPGTFPRGCWHGTNMTWQWIWEILHGLLCSYQFQHPERGGICKLKRLSSWSGSSGQIALPVCTPWPSARATLQGREDRATLVIKGSSALFYFVTGHYNVTVLIDQPLPWFPLIS